MVCEQAVSATAQSLEEKFKRDLAHHFQLKEQEFAVRLRQCTLSH